jgi:hypothetical protein
MHSVLYSYPPGYCTRAKGNTAIEITALFSSAHRMQILAVFDFISVLIDFGYGVAHQGIRFCPEISRLARTNI